MWSQWAVKTNGHKMGVAMLLALGGLAFFVFLRHDVTMWWQYLWVFSLVVALGLITDGQAASQKKCVTQEASLQQEMENGALWKSRFETLSQQLQREKEKILSLEQDRLLLEEKHEERIEALKQLIELTSSESSRHRHRLEHLLRERDAFEEQTHTLGLEIEALKSAAVERKEPLFTNEESLKRLEALNEERFDNYQLRLLLSERRKEQKIQEKVKRERSPRALNSTGQEKITLQDLAKVISKNIR